MLFRQSAKHDSYYISYEKNLENGYYATLSTSVLGGGGGLSTPFKCLFEVKTRKGVRCCGLLLPLITWQHLTMQNREPIARNEQRLPLSFYHDEYK